MDKHKKGKKNSGSEARLKRFKKILWGGLATGIVLAVLLFFLIGCEFFINYKLEFRKKGEK